MGYGGAIRRLFWMIPALILVSVLAFFLSRAIPGDPVIAFMEEPLPQANASSGFFKRQEAYTRTAANLGLDKPLFYFSLHAHVLSDTLYRILPPGERSAARQLALESGSWPGVQELRKGIYKMIRRLEKGGREGTGISYRSWQNELAFALEEGSRDRVLHRIDGILDDPAMDSDQMNLRLDFLELQGFARALGEKEGKFLWWPAFSWYGRENQFHHWFSGVLRGDFGVSARDSRPVFSRIREALKWTLWLNGLALFLAFAIAIPTGVWLARQRNRRAARWTRAGLFAAYAMPSFWLATIMVVFFTTPEYGKWLDWFPTQGLGNYRNAEGAGVRIAVIAWHLALPVFCLTVGSLAYISQQMKQSIEHELKADYFLFYRSFGMSERRAVWQQAFRNALFPMITILGGAIPVLFSGSLIIEVIFNIPGIGRLMYGSILAKDWNVVFGVLLMTSAITMVSYLLTDIAYQVADPKLRHGGRSKSMPA